MKTPSVVTEIDRNAYESQGLVEYIGSPEHSFAVQVALGETFARQHPVKGYGLYRYLYSIYDHDLDGLRYYLGR